eukprot:3112272-Rhodomonas_salina.1
MPTARSHHPCCTAKAYARRCTCPQQMRDAGLVVVVVVLVVVVMRRVVVVVMRRVCCCCCCCCNATCGWANGVERHDAVSCCARTCSVVVEEEKTRETDSACACGASSAMRCAPSSAPCTAGTSRQVTLRFHPPAD